uniref:Uncharacterized protein n=1 Tax=Oryza punctata TaxID=4537 RepID=A0A0E0KVY6_ORYPU
MATKALVYFAILIATSQIFYVVTSRQLPLGNPIVRASSSLVTSHVSKGASNGQVPNEIGITEEKALLYAPNILFRPPPPCTLQDESMLASVEDRVLLDSRENTVESRSIVIVHSYPTPAKVLNH